MCGMIARIARSGSNPGSQVKVLPLSNRIIFGTFILFSLHLPLRYPRQTGIPRGLCDHRWLFYRYSAKGVLLFRIDYTGMPP